MNRKPEDKMSSQQKSLTPAILGIASGSHGAKFSPNMNQKDKQLLLMKLEARRQERKEKLTATVLGRGKQLNSLKVVDAMKPKIKTVLNPSVASHGKQYQCDGKKSVFDRLYEQGGKQNIRKTEESTAKNVIKKVPVVKPLKYMSDEKVQIPKVVITNEESHPDSPSSGNELPQTSMENTHPEFEEQFSSEVFSTMEETLPVGDTDLSKNDGKSDEKENQINVTEEENKWNGDSQNTFPVICATEKCNINKIHVNGDKKINRVMEKKSFQGMLKPIRSFPKKSIMQKQKPPLRRSISLIFRKKSGNYENAIHRTHSEINLAEVKEDVEYAAPVKEGQNNGRVEDDHFKKVDDCKKFMNKKRIVSFATPKNKALSALHLRDTLENWLAENGHSIETYRHLRCFGLQGEATPYAQRYRQQKAEDSSNNSFYSTAPSTPTIDIVDESDKENVTPPVSAPKIEVKDVEGWLGDLYCLIVHVKYPTDRCEEWLRAISKKFPDCNQLSIYWECLAAMNSDEKNLKTVEENEGNSCNEGPCMDNSLTELFDKLVIDSKCQSASKTERGLNVKNIFKSKTLKFALQEKAVKELDPELGKEARRKVLVATPVRRSARLQTPDKSNIIGSLKSLDPEMRKNLSFQPNQSLFSD